MRRPPELTCLKLDRYEYKLIGEIVVLSGLMEQHLKDLPQCLKATKFTAFTAHLNFQSLCDLNLALLPDTVQHAPLRAGFEKAIKKCRKVYDDRSRLVHGPFFPYPSGIKGTIRVTARRKIAFQGYQFDRDSLHELLSEFITAFEDLQICIVALQAVHGELPPGVE